MRRPFSSWEWVAPVVSALAFVLFAAVFVRELGSFRAAVTDWATRDLNARVAMAAETLRDPLRTADFPALQSFAATCEREGLRLTVRSAQGGVFFDSRTRSGDAEGDRYLYARCPCGDYELALGLPYARVYAPFRRARFGFLLAALAGASAVFIVFFIFYRQRVRIAELTRLERFRREFVADVSHEIKTPLTGILGAVDLLSDTVSPDAANARRLLDMVRRESVRLDALVQQILDLARLERTDAPHVLNLAQVDLADLVREGVARFASEAAQRHVRLVAEALPVPGALVANCDAQRVQQALANLIANALRHAASDDVTVTLTVSEKKVAGRRAPARVAAIAVEDHGVGIPSAARERVFERFHRLDESRACETGGAGLGLPIVRQIARLHGGDVTLEPVVPHGCRFTLALPLPPQRTVDVKMI